MDMILIPDPGGVRRSVHAAQDAGDPLPVPTQTGEPAVTAMASSKAEVT
jgi:hypothetical protein